MKSSHHIQTRVIAASNQSLSEMVENGTFREDLFWRLSGKVLRLPPLRERREDIEPLANYFLKKERPKRNKTLAVDAIHLMGDYHWPGNVRELKRAVERVSLTSPLPLIRAEDIQPILRPVSQSLHQSLDLSKGLSQLLADHEKLVITKTLERTPDIDDAAKTLGISRSNLYKKIKDYQLQ